MSGSLLLIAIVWLVLLAPLLLRNSRPVRRTSEALGETRVVFSGESVEARDSVLVGSNRSLRTMRKLRPAAAHYVDDVDAELELVDAEPEYVVFDDADVAAGGLGSPAIVDGAVVEDDAPVAGAVEIVDAEASDADTDTVIDAGAEEDAGVDAADDSVAIVEADENTDVDADVVADGDAVADADVEVERDDVDHRDAAPSSAAFAAARDIPTAYLRGGDVDTSVVLDDELDTPVFSAAEDDYLQQVGAELHDLDSKELTAEDLAFVESRRGRGMYDPIASKKLADQRVQRLVTITLWLIPASVVAGVAAAFIGSWMWAAFGCIAAVTIINIVVLRRNAVAEARLQQRRLVRMRRARLGVRNAEDEELGIPQRLRRPGAYILEVDDVDPSLQHLPFVDGAQFIDAPHGRGAQPHEEQHISA